MLEEAIALGCRKFVACGGAGVLDRSIDLGYLIVPTVAIRDEGTSYHYLPPGREVEPSPERRFRHRGGAQEARVCLPDRQDLDDGRDLPRDGG